MIVEQASVVVAFEDSWLAGIRHALHPTDRMERFHAGAPR
jgi:hypothetical protein